MRLLIAFISILLLASVVSGTAVSVTIYGTNKSNAQDNITCYGCNNTISVQAWNTSYVKNITIESKNGSGGDVVSFNISNVTAFQVQELKVNKTAVNAYQAGANGMLNFSYTVVGNKTLLLSPAQNVNGYNMTWLYAWSLVTATNIMKPTMADATVYQNTNNTDRHVSVSLQYLGGPSPNVTVWTGAKNPPTTPIANALVSTTMPVFFIVKPQHYFMINYTANNYGIADATWWN